MIEEYKTLTIEKLDKREYEAAIKAVNKVRQERAQEVARAKAIRMIIDAVEEALKLVHPIDLVDTLDVMLSDVMIAAEDEARTARGE